MDKGPVVEVEGCTEARARKTNSGGSDSRAGASKSVLPHGCWSGLSGHPGQHYRRGQGVRLRARAPSEPGTPFIVRTWDWHRSCKVKFLNPLGSKTHLRNGTYILHRNTLPQHMCPSFWEVHTSPVLLWGLRIPGDTEENPSRSHTFQGVSGG